MAHHLRFSLQVMQVMQVAQPGNAADAVKVDPVQENLKVVVIGTAHVHTAGAIAEISSHPEVELVGIALPDADSPAEVPSGLAVFDSLGNLPEHDAAVIMTDIDSHDRVLKQLQCRKVFIEKPLGLNARRAEQIAAGLETRGIQAELGFFLRRSPELTALRDSLRRGELGTIRHVNIQFAHSGFSGGWLKPYPAHMSVKRQGYGTFGDLASHVLDFAGSVFGALTPVSCQLDYEPGDQVDAQGHALLLTDTGVRMTVWTGALSAVGTLSIDIFGEQGAARLRDGQLNLTGPDRQPQTSTAELSPSAGLRVSLDSFLGKEVPRSASLAEAIETNRLLDRLYELAGAN